MSRDLPCRQGGGGGVLIDGGTVNFQSCEVHDNKADGGVRACFPELS